MDPGLFGQKSPFLALFGGGVGTKSAKKRISISARSAGGRLFCSQRDPSGPPPGPGVQASPFSQCPAQWRARLDPLLPLPKQFFTPRNQMQQHHDNVMISLSILLLSLFICLSTFLEQVEQQFENGLAVQKKTSSKCHKNKTYAQK